jgi:hypothetical protein
MDATASPLTDPIALVQQLDADAIRGQIETLDRQRQALLVLLRAALRTRPEPRTKEGSPHA